MTRGFLLLIARLCIAAIFLFSAISKFVFYDATFQYMASKNLPMIPVLLIGAAIVELIGSLSIIFGYKARAGAILLMLFLIPTTYLFHAFWNETTDAGMALQRILFLKNLAIFGGLLYIACDGPGKWSCDRCHAESCHAHACDLHSKEIHKDERINGDTHPKV